MDNELRQTLADVPFSDDAGVEGLLAANMEPQYFNGLVKIVDGLIATAILESNRELLKHLQKAEKRFGKVDWKAALYELEDRDKIRGDVTLQEPEREP